MDMVSIFKNEKGVAALKSLQDNSSTGGGARVTSSVKKAKPASKAKASKVAASSKAIMKANPKKSVAKLGKKSVPRMATPGASGSAQQTPAASKNSFAKMKAFLQKKGKK